MKTIKKLLPLLLVVVMVISMATSALAAGNGSITINNTEDGKTYEIYKVFDLTQSGTAVSYTVSDAWEGFFFSGNSLTTLGQNYLLTTQPSGASLSQIVYNGTAYYINIGDSASGATKTAADFANDAMAYAVAASPDDYDTATGTSLVFSNLDLGYYLVLPVDATGIATGNNSMCSLTNAAPDGVINAKGIYPDINKTINDQDVEVGQIVTYTITGVVPDTAGYDTFTYRVSDTMDSGLTFGETAATTNFTVEFGETTIYDSSTSLPEGMALDFDNNGFVVNFDMVKFQNYKGQPITISYNAVVNDGAVCQLTENDAYLEYGHDPDDLEETTHKEIEVYSSKIIVDKYDANDNTKKLPDAKFVLYKEVPENGATIKYYYLYTAASTGNPATVTWIPENSVASDWSNVTELTTDDNGAATFSGLESGDYYLHETASPDGYNLMTSDTLVTISAPQINNEGKGIGVSVTSSIANNTGSTLPDTGGIGTTIFYIVGSILLIGAGVLLFVRKRMSYEK